MNNRARRGKLARHLVKLARQTDGREERAAAEELVQIIRWASEEAPQWIECAGDENRIAPPGFGPVNISTILPHKSAKGRYISRIERDDPNILENVNDNDLSLALSITYCGVNVVLGGDGTVTNWTARRRFEQQSGRKLNANVVGLPHHGSRIDAAPTVLSNIFAETGKRTAVTSANGHSHPSLEVIEWISEQEIAPYCTNLMPACGARAQSLFPMPTVDPQLGRVLREAATSLPVIQTCQGDISVTIFEDGRYEVVPQHNSFCGFRSDYEVLFAP